MEKKGESDLKIGRVSILLCVLDSTRAEGVCVCGCTRAHKGIGVLMHLSAQQGALDRACASV